MTNNISSESAKFGDDSQAILISSEPWADKPVDIPFELRTIRLSEKLFSGEKKGIKRRQEVVDKSGLPLEIVEFIENAYRTAAIVSEANGDRRLVPNIDPEVNPWNPLWRISPGKKITFSFRLIIEGEPGQEIKFDITYPPSLEEKWKVSVTPRLWKIYEEKSGGAKLRIDIEESVSLKNPGVESRHVPSVKFIPEDEKELDRLGYNWDIRLNNLLFDEWEGALSENTLRKNRIRTDFGMKIVVDPQFVWSDQERQKYKNAIDKNDGKTVCVPVRLCVEESHPVSVLVEIVPYVAAFPGFLSIDLGLNQVNAEAEISQKLASCSAQG